MYNIMSLTTRSARKKANLNAVIGAALGNTPVGKAFRSTVSSVARKGIDSVRKSYEKTERKSQAKPKQNKQEITKLKRGMKSLKCKADASMGKFTNRFSAFQQLFTGSNLQQAIEMDVNSITQMEAALTGLLYYDPSAPATLVASNLTTGSYSKEICFRSIYSKVTARNNYGMPAHVTIYRCEPVGDTDIDCRDAWVKGIADNPFVTTNGVASIASLNQYPSDFDTTRKLWKYHKAVSKLVQPGQEISTSYGIKTIDYDIALADVHSLEYQKKYKAWSYLIVVHGVAGHAPSPAITKGICSAGLDIVQDTTYKIEYDAGIQLQYVTVNNTGGTCTSVSNKPASANQALDLT